MDRYIDKTELGERELLVIEGTVERVLYRNDETGYVVCDLECEGGDFATVVGIMPFLGEGETIKVTGKWEVHSTYGRQFRAEYHEKQLPATSAAILKYLSSNTVKGIGRKTAERLVDRYGEETFDVLENHPEWIAELPGMSLGKAEKISENFKEQFGIRNLMMFCRDFLGPSTAVKIYKKWGGAALDLIKENPYVLCDEIYGVGFERADRMAKAVGILANARTRVKAGIKYILSYNAYQNGHVFIPRDKLLPASADMLGVDTAELEDALEELCEAKQVYDTKIGSRSCVYLEAYYEAERYTASKLDQLEKLCPKLDDGDVEKFIGQIEESDGIKYAPMQHKAIVCAVNSGVMVLTGGPGTGKTTVIKAVIQVFDRLGYDITLAAPTGRAAKRMSEATQSEAKTIHRLLEMEYADDTFPRFKRSESNLLDEDVIIIDETSMVDTLLMSALLKAIKPGARLILIGDADQLPPVGAGYVLNDIIDSDRFNTVKLKEIFRQAKESLIVTNAHSINNGKYPALNVKDSDFFFVVRDNDEDIANTVADLCYNRLPKTYGDHIRESAQVITPSRKGAAGTEMLNRLMQQVINPPSPQKRERKLRDFVFREGDKIMQIRNNYDIAWEKDGKEGIGIFNGDIGIIESINFEEENAVIVFDERVAVYDFTMFDELDHAYAITVHKSQGSEYPVVVIPVYRFTPKLLTRNLLYTAVTRAQEMVVMVGQSDVVKMMVDNNRQTKRYTGLGYLLSCYDEES